MLVKVSNNSNSKSISMTTMMMNDDDNDKDRYRHGILRLTLDSTPVARANEVRARKAAFMMTM